MHILIRIVSAILLLLVAGIVSGKWFALEKEKPFQFGRKMFRSQYFWLGIGVGLVFLFSDYEFQHIMSLPL